MTKIRVTKRAFPRRITYTHLVRPLMRHSSRIKLFTRNWPKSHFFHPLSFVPPPPSNTTPSRKGKKEKDRRNFPDETNGSSRRNSSKKSPNLFRIYSARKVWRIRVRGDFLEMIPSKRGAKRGGRLRYWSARRKHSLSTTDFFPRDETRLDFCIRDDRGESRVEKEGTGGCQPVKGCCETGEILVTS